MENQKTGFIPLYRSVLKKPWAKDVFLRTLWENLLLGAARQPYTANFKGRQPDCSLSGSRYQNRKKPQS